MITRPFQSVVAGGLAAGFLVFVPGAIGGLAGNSSGGRLDSYLSLPPVLREEIGNPPVFISKRGSARSYRARLERFRPTLSSRKVSGGSVRKNSPGAGAIQLIRVTAPARPDEVEIKRALAAGVLEHAWNTRAKGRSQVFQLIELDRKRFLRIGIGHLTGRSVSDDPAENAWWRLRMGLPQKRSNDFHLVILTTHTWEDSTPYGHFAFGLRRNGGDPENDLIFDPRAPWHHDHAPGFQDWLNTDNFLINGFHQSNLYDWIHTQSYHRGLLVRADFLPISQDQLTLIQALARRNLDEDLGPFRAFRNNCATLSRAVLEGLQPRGERIGTRHPIADIPIRLQETVSEELDVSVRVEIPSLIANTDKKRTFVSTIHQVPDRRKTPGFRQLRSVPEIN